MSIKRLQTVCVTTDDVDACSRFYQAALGLEVRFRDGGRWVQFTLDGANFAVASQSEGATGGRGATVVFEATEDADHARMPEAGARELGQRDMGSHGRTRTYADPAGNVLQLLWRA